MIGQTVSHYQITEKLGQGGMGVVYKALDTKLDRTVALKFLSTSALPTDDDKARFHREAKAAAQLNHPHIATVFEIDETDDGQAFIAMEFIDGETLAQKIKRGPLKLREAITIAIQVASGLQAAHERGIVHRDVKSSNVMLDERGQVKVMDFGLAKTEAATMLTKEGTALGTVSYMSPEQARGEAVDHRTDLWSLGVVLYEMISGQLPFKGDYEQAVIYSILNGEPEPLTSVRTGVPMKLEEIVTKLLAKEADERYQHIIELPVDLKNVSLQASQTSQSRTLILTDTLQQEQEVNVKVKFSYKTLLTIAASVVLTFLLTWIVKPGPPLPAPKRPNKMVVTLPENTSLFLSDFNRMAISPDGMDIVYISIGSGLSPRLFLKRAASFDVIELEGGGTFGVRSPFFSPDGRWIGYFLAGAHEMYKVLVDGGEPFKITSSSSGQSSATWAPDHTIIFTDDKVLNRISESGGESTILTKTKSDGERHRFPHMLPDDKTVLFTIASAGGELNTNRLAVYRFGDDDYHHLGEEGYNAVYSPSGHLLYGRSERLMAVPFDLSTLTITGVPALVLDNVQTRPSGGMSYALSKEGTLIYVPGTGWDNSLRSVLSVDLSGNATEFFDLKRGFQFARYSPDGNYVAFVIDEQNDSNIWIYHIEDRALNQLTFYKGGPHRFAWSSDSKTLAYGTEAEDSTNSIYIKRIDGTGTAQKIYTSSLLTDMAVKDWSGDGDKISFDPEVESSWDLYVYSFQDSSATPYLATPAIEVEPYFSPNGKWLLYQSDTNPPEVYVSPYPDRSGGLWKISNGGGSKPVWSPDGKKIYYRSGNAMYVVDVTATDVFLKSNPRKIFEGNYFLPTGRRFDIHPDGDKFIMMQGARGESQAQQLFVIQNFSEEVKRLAPPGN